MTNATLCGLRAMPLVERWLSSDPPGRTTHISTRWFLFNACGDAMTAFGPTRTTWALQQVVRYLRHTGHGADAVAEAARDPQQTWLMKQPFSRRTDARLPSQCATTSGHAHFAQPT